MKIGQIYNNFGCKWIVDDIYKVDPETVKAHELYYNIRYKAHVIEAPDGYKGIREIDAGYKREALA